MKHKNRVFNMFDDLMPHGAGFPTEKKCPMKGRMCQCSDKEKCIHQPIEELQPYAERSREDWIKWAESEIVEYQKFLNFLKKKV